MPAITFDDFAGGLDVRYAQVLSRANILRILKNAYVTTGKSIKKRPCGEKIATLEAGTVGLKSFQGKLCTFYGSAAAINHANTLFVAKRVPHITTGAAPTKIHYADQYNALLYVAAEYGDGTFRHHYLDGGSAATPAWVALTNYAAGNFVQPTVPNGFRYEVTVDAGSAGAGEPVWPTTLGSTVVDGGITWTCRTFQVADVNCPHTKQVAKTQSKMFAVGVDATTVRYCKTGDPRDWTAVSDAGFIAAGLNARGSDRVTAINLYGNRQLAVFFSDNAQLWQVDPNPSNIQLTSNIEGVGTVHHRAAGPVSIDLFFHAQTGYRSLSFVTLTNNMQDSDVGSPIDDLIAADIEESDDPIALYYPKRGQFWVMNGNVVWAYSFSRTAKISAWAKFTFPFSIDDATVLNQELYVRSGNDVYKINDQIFKDGASDIPEIEMLMFAQDGKKPGVLKQFLGVDVMGVGNWMISFQYYDPEIRQWRETAQNEYPAITEPGNMYPMEMMATRVAPRLTHRKDEAAELSSLMMYYEPLGPV